MKPDPDAYGFTVVGHHDLFGVTETRVWMSQQHVEATPTYEDYIHVSSMIWSDPAAGVTPTLPPFTHPHLARLPEHCLGELHDGHSARLRG